MLFSVYICNLFYNLICALFSQTVSLTDWSQHIVVLRLQSNYIFPRFILFELPLVTASNPDRKQRIITSTYPETDGTGITARFWQLFLCCRKLSWKFKVSKNLLKPAVRHRQYYLNLGWVLLILKTIWYHIKMGKN